MNASKESKMRNLIFVKYDITQTELLFAQTLQSVISVYVDTPSRPLAGYGLPPPPPGGIL